MKADFAPLLTMIVVACATVLPLPYVQEAKAAPSVVGLWRFNEGSGPTASDSSGLGNNGTLTGENGNVPAWVAGQSGFGGALSFTNNGNDHAYVNIPGASSLMVGQTATNAWSFTCWAFEDSNGTGNFVSSYGRMLTMDDGLIFQLESGAVGDSELYTWSALNASWQIPWGIGSSVAPLLDQWVHWAVVYDGTNITIYRNGNQGINGGVASSPVTGSLGLPNYTGAILIGSELDGGPALANWNGMLDDVAVFDGALTQSQVDTVMTGDFSSFIGGPVNFVSGPQSQTVLQGSSVSFSVGVAGQAPFQYQWYFNGTNKLSSVSNPTATNATLVLSNIQLNQAGTYSVVVSNSVGRATNAPVTLTVFRYQPLVGLWRFNQGNGTNVPDSSGLGNNGFLAGENGDVPAWTTGQTGFGDSLYFTNNGTDHAFVVIPSSGTLLIGQTATNPWTITTWAYEKSDGAGNFVASYGRFMVIDDGTAFQLESGAVGDGEIYTWARANGAWQLGWGIGSSVAPLLDQWVHWAVVYDGTNITVYRNGNQGPNGGVASMIANAPLGGYIGFQDGILIGAELAQDGTRTWNGMLDDEAVFNVALSQAQIQTVMAGNFSAFITQPPPQLSISSGAGNVVLSWPEVQAAYQLQSTPSLAPSAWTSVTNLPVQNGSAQTVTLPVGSGTRFFRLTGP
ncbi:MAG TPA: LamG-like jellyroll fold domain-containing protein [Verrucomicrobiae bacterium]|nr:LamG-like jellyroll fold domain-containing protein [Verrucomicrobiae bacterium]